MSLCLLEPQCLAKVSQHVAVVTFPPYSAGEQRSQMGPDSYEGFFSKRGAVFDFFSPALFDPRETCLVRKQDVHRLHQTAPH